MPEGGRTIHVTIPYTPRSQFQDFHDRTQRFSIGVAHRRAGKTVAHVNDLIRGALTCQRSEPRFAYIAPLFSQAKDIAWSYLKHYALVVPGAVANETELRVDFPNAGRVRLYGADNPDRLRGIYLDGVVLDEYAQMRAGLWSSVIRPALADRQGWAAFIGTPMGRNEFCELYERAKDDPAWHTFILKASETDIIPAGELAAARAEMTEDEYAQEFECSFTAAIRGSYYGKLLAAAETDKRIANVPYDPALQVWTAWDLGIGDSTSIWFAQQIGKEVRLIDFYETSGAGLDHYVKVLREKPYAYAEHYLPHDVAVQELGTGRSRLETLTSLGLARVRVLPNQAVEDGINAARLLIPRCWFDKAKCAAGLEALRQYRAEYDDKLRTLKSRPLHDWTSHAADAFRYLAMGIKPKAKPNELKQDYRWVV